MLLSIQGMDCPSCAHKVVRALRTLPSVADVRVNAFAGHATLAYTEGLVFPADIAQRATELTGFACAVLEEVQADGVHRTMRVGLASGTDIAWAQAELPPTVRVRSATAGRVQVVLDVEFDACVIKPRDVLAAFGVWDGVFVPATRPSSSAQAHAELVALLQRTTVAAALSIPVLVFAWAPLPPHSVAYGGASLALTTLIQVFVAAPLYSSALRTLFLQRVLDMDFLIVLSSTIAYLFSAVAYFLLVAGRPFSDAFFETPALLITLIVLGRLISAYARRRATSALAAVHTLQPDTVELLTYPDHAPTRIPADLVHVGDILLVPPHARVPTDGTVLAGHSAVDESALTGESAPVEKAPGAVLTAGTLNGTGVLRMRVARAPADNTVADISRLLAQVQDARLPAQDLADRLAGYLAPAILAISVVVFSVWVAVGVAARGQATSVAAVAALRYAVAVLIVSCPCALVLCVPMVVVIAAGVAARHGVLVKVCSFPLHTTQAHAPCSSLRRSSTRRTCASLCSTRRARSRPARSLSCMHTRHTTTRTRSALYTPLSARASTPSPRLSRRISVPHTPRLRRPICTTLFLSLATACPPQPARARSAAAVQPGSA
jgi:cation transport ATPase